MTAAAGPSHDRRAAWLLIGMLVPGLAGNMSFQALIPELIRAWGLSHTEVGWISTINYLAYAAAAPLLVAVTDRIDGRRMVILGCSLSALGGLGFASTAEGFWTAMLWRSIVGVGIAATYMPGLKALTDRTEGPSQGRQQALYTATYSVGTSISMLVTGVAASSIGWQSAFALTGLLPAFAALLVGLGTRPAVPAAKAGRPSLLDYRPILAQRRALGFAIAYGAHCWELFGFRTWILAFLTFVTLHWQTPLAAATIAVWATLLLLLGLPASLLGNELATRLPRSRTVSVLMLSSAVIGCLLGPMAGFGLTPCLVLLTLYSMIVMADSAAVTVGTIAAARPELKGATLAFQTLLGSIGAMIAPLASGIALDAFGAENVLGWTAAFVIVAGGALVGPLALSLLARDEPALLARDEPE